MKKLKISKLSQDFRYLQEVALKTLQQMQTQMAKTNERISMMESRFERHLRPFAPSQAPPDGELLDYTEDEASLVNETDQAIKPSHETNLS